MKGDLLMENIILQIVIKTALNFLNYFEVNGLRSLDKMAGDLKLISDDMAVQTLAAFI